MNISISHYQLARYRSVFLLGGIVSLFMIFLFCIQSVRASEISDLEAARMQNMRKYAEQVEATKNAMNTMYHMDYFHALPDQMYTFSKSIIEKKSNADFSKVIADDLSNRLMNTSALTDAALDPKKVEVKGYVYSKIAAQGCASLLKGEGNDSLHTVASDKGWSALYKKVTAPDTSDASVSPVKSWTQETYQSSLTMFSQLMDRCSQIYRTNNDTADMILYAHFGHAFMNQSTYDSPYDVIHDIVSIDKLVFAGAARANQLPLWVGQPTSYGSTLIQDLGSSFQALYKLVPDSFKDIQGLPNKDIGTTQTIEQVFSRAKQTYQLDSQNTSLPTCVPATAPLLTSKATTALQPSEQNAVLDAFTRDELQKNLPEAQTTSSLKFTTKDQEWWDTFWKNVNNGGELFSWCGDWSTSKAKNSYSDPGFLDANGGLCVKVDMVASTQSLIDWVSMEDLALLGGNSSLLEIIGTLKDLTKSVKERDLTIQRIPRQNFQLSDLDWTPNLSTSLTVKFMPSFPRTSEENQPEKRKEYANKLLSVIGGTATSGGQGQVGFTPVTEMNVKQNQLSDEAMAEAKKTRAIYKENQKILTIANTWNEYGQRITERYGELTKELATLQKEAGRYVTIAAAIASIPCYK